MTAAPSSPPDQNIREYETHAVDATVALGRALGGRLNHGIVLLLHGGLGSGKTAFAQGLARGLGVPESWAVTSPTYTLINEYAARLPFYHVDLYRLAEPVDPEEIGLEDMFDPTGVIAVEWPERLHPSDRPARRLDLFFTITGDNARSIRIIASGLDPADLLNDIGV
ncbi:MAG: tRNA (adenosine(37)-N6)-threonylcarbamoyltransferase complex ATPase subunit type 1 TsaE [Desulfosarcina sp.]